MLVFLHRLLLVVFPFILLSLEASVRTAANNPEVATFFPPSLAVAGLGQLLPAVRTGRHAVPGIKKTVDEWVAGLSLILLLIGIALWHSLLVASLGKALPSWMPHVSWFGFTTEATLSLLLYCFSTFFSELKNWAEK